MTSDSGEQKRKVPFTRLCYHGGSGNLCVCIVPIDTSLVGPKAADLALKDGRVWKEGPRLLFNRGSLELVGGILFLYLAYRDFGGGPWGSSVGGFTKARSQQWMRNSRPPGVYETMTQRRGCYCLVLFSDSGDLSSMSSMVFTGGDANSLWECPCPACCGSSCWPGLLAFCQAH